MDAPPGANVILLTLCMAGFMPLQLFHGTVWVASSAMTLGMVVWKQNPLYTDKTSCQRHLNATPL